MKKALALALSLLVFCGLAAHAQSANSGYPESSLQPSYAADTGSSTAYVVNPPGCGALWTGEIIKVLPGHANTSTSPTLAYCGLTAHTITKFGTAALSTSNGGDLITTEVAVFLWDGTDYELLDPATLSVSGGSVTDGSGVTTANECVVSTTTGHVVAYNSNCVLASGGYYSTYGGLTTAGLGLDTVLGVSDVTAQSASQTSVNLIASTTAAGHYLVRLYIDQNALCTTGTGSVYATVSWTDATHAHTAMTIPLTLANTAISSSQGFVDAAIPLWSASSSAITYTTTYAACATGTGTYDLHAEVERTN